MIIRTRSKALEKRDRDNEEPNIIRSSAFNSLTSERRRKKKKTSPCVPRFLTKTRQMINECDPSIASWSEDGRMIVIKDVERFEKEVVPVFFETEKFASFNRQLNFYGFRKIPSTNLRRSDSSGIEHKKMLQFQNDFFKRDEPELICRISRSTKHMNAAGIDQQEEIERLKTQLRKAEEKLCLMSIKYDSKLAQMQRHFDKRIETILRDYMSNSMKT